MNSRFKIQNSRFKVIKALFDIKPVDEAGRVDVSKIYGVRPVVNLAPTNRAQDVRHDFAKKENPGILYSAHPKPAEIADFGKYTRTRDSGSSIYNSSVAQTKNPTKSEALSGTNLVRAFSLPPVDINYTPSIYSVKDGVDNPSSVEVRGIEPPGLRMVSRSSHQATPTVKLSYQLNSKKQNPVAELEKYLNSNLNINKELKNIGGKTVVRRKVGKPRYRPILAKSKLGISNDEFLISKQCPIISDQISPNNDYEVILSQINQKPIFAMEAEFVGEPRRIEPFDCWGERLLTTSDIHWTSSVKAQPEIESWVAYAKSDAADFQSNLKFQISLKLQNWKLEIRNWKLRIKSFFELKKLLILGIIGLTALAFVLLGHYGVGIKNEIVRESSSAVANLEQANESLRVFDFEAASNNFAEAYGEFSKAGENLNFMGASITSIFAELPGFDKLTAGGAGKLKSAKNLVEAGKLLAEAGKSMSEAVNSLSQTGAILKLTNNPIYYTGQTSIVDLKKSLATSSKDLSKASALLSEVNLDVLPEDKREKFTEFKSKLPEFEGVVSDAVEYTNFLEGFLDASGTKRYLILFQNSSELRPTGGFPGTYAVVTFKDGRLSDILVDDVYNLDGQLKENIIPPQPLQHITPNWGMRDANWFIDFSVSAQKTMEFFKKEAGYEVDGVITMSPQTISDILKIVGPIEMPEYDFIINNENFLSTIQAEVEYGDNRQQPKKVVVDMAPRLLERVYSSDPGQWLDIFNVFMSGLDKKDILMYFKDLNLENFVAEKGFGGLVKNGGDDYLMVTFSNIKGSKTDKVTDNSIKLNSQFTIHNSQPAVKHRLTITRQHNGGSTKYGFYNKPNPAYVRILVPENSELISVSGNSNPRYKPLIGYSEGDFKEDKDLLKMESDFRIEAEKGVNIYEESGKTGFAFWLVTDPGQIKTVELEYVTPFEYGKDSYDIYIQKQPGLEVDSFEFQVDDAYIYNGEFDKDLELRFKVK